MRQVHLRGQRDVVPDASTVRCPSGQNACSRWAAHRAFREQRDVIVDPTPSVSTTARFRLARASNHRTHSSARALLFRHTYDPTPNISTTARFRLARASIIDHRTHSSALLFRHTYRHSRNAKTGLCLKPSTLHRDAACAPCPLGTQGPRTQGRRQAGSQRLCLHPLLEQYRRTPPAQAARD